MFTRTGVVVVLFLATAILASIPLAADGPHCGLVADKDDNDVCGPKETNPFSFQTGIFFPSEDQIKNETNRVWAAFHLDYRISASEAGEMSIGAGYYGRHGTFASGTRVMRVIPITIDAKFKSSEGASKGWFGKVGAGAYIVRDERTVGAASEDVDTTTIGWQAGLGYESDSGRSVQLGYIDARQRDFRGVTFTLGARF